MAAKGESMEITCVDPGAEVAPPRKVESSEGEKQARELQARIQEFWQQRLEGSEGEGASPPPRAEKEALTWALGKLPVSLFPRVPKVVEVESSVSLLEAISILESHNFRCLPVRSSEHRDSRNWNQRYLGVADHPGIVLWVFAALGAGPEDVAAETESPSRALLGLAASTAATLYAEYTKDIVHEETALDAAVERAAPSTGEAPEEGGGNSGVPGKGAMSKGAWYATTGVEGMRERFRDEILKNAIFQENKVGDVVGSFRFTPFIPVEPSESVLSLLLLMAKERVRLAPVIDPQGDEILNVITPMGVLDFLCLCHGMPWFDSVASRPLEGLGLPVMAPDAMVTVSEGDRMMEPFRLMLEHDISAVPVVEPLEGGGGGEASGKGGVRVVANISSSDILHLLHSPRLFEGDQDPSFLTVKDFMEAVEMDTGLGGKREPVGPVIRPPICCRPGDSLAQVMHTLRRARIRRMYVVGEGERLEGVVTLRDVIAVFTGSEFGKPSRVEGYGA